MNLLFERFVSGALLDRSPRYAGQRRLSEAESSDDLGSGRRPAIPNGDPGPPAGSTTWRGPRAAPRATPSTSSTTSSTRGRSPGRCATGLPVQPHACQPRRSAATCGDRLSGFWRITLLEVRVRRRSDGPRRAQTVLTVPHGWMPSGDFDLTWSPDGASLLVPHGVLVPLDGGAPRKLPWADRPLGWEKYSPDGSRLAYGANRSLVVAEADGSNPQEVFDDSATCPSHVQQLIHLLIGQGHPTPHARPGNRRRRVAARSLGRDSFRSLPWVVLLRRPISFVTEGTSEPRKSPFRYLGAGEALRSQGDHALAGPLPLLQEDQEIGHLLPVRPLVELPDDVGADLAGGGQDPNNGLAAESQLISRSAASRGQVRSEVLGLLGK